MESFKFLCGIVKNPFNDNWQAWLSLNGDDVKCFYAHKDRTIVETVVDILRNIENYSETLGLFLDKISQIPETELVQLLPQENIKQILESINESTSF